MPEMDEHELKVSEDDIEQLSEEDVPQFATTSTPPTHRITLQIDYEEGEPFGIVFGKNLTIINVKKDMRADGILFPGDTVISINDIQVEDEDQFYNLIKRLFPVARIEVERKLWRTPLTDLRAKQIGLLLRKNYEYFIAYIHRIEGMKLGLSVKQSHNTVIVTKCKEDSMVSRCFEEGDHIIDVDGLRVFSKSDAKQRIVNTLKNNACVSAVIERKRPEGEQTSSNRMILVVSDRNPKMAPDAVRIGQRESARIRASAGKQFPLRSILKSNSSKSTNILQFDPKPVIMRVACDTLEPNRLIHVRRKDSGRSLLSVILGKKSGIFSKRS